MYSQSSTLSLVSHFLIKEVAVQTFIFLCSSIYYKQGSAYNNLLDFDENNVFSLYLLFCFSLFNFVFLFCSYGFSDFQCTFLRCLALVDVNFDFLLCKYSPITLHKLYTIQKNTIQFIRTPFIIKSFIRLKCPAIFSIVFPLYPSKQIPYIHIVIFF